MDNQDNTKKLIVNLLSLLGSTKEEVNEKLQILKVKRDQETRCPIASYLSENGVGKGANIWVWAFEGRHFKFKINQQILIKIGDMTDDKWTMSFFITGYPTLKGVYDFISSLSYRQVEHTAVSMSN